MNHTCERQKHCICERSANGPHDNCPKHGANFIPKCIHCGRYMPIRFGMPDYGRNGIDMPEDADGNWVDYCALVDFATLAIEAIEKHHSGGRSPLAQAHNLAIQDAINTLEMMRDEL